MYKKYLIFLGKKIKKIYELLIVCSYLIFIKFFNFKRLKRYYDYIFYVLKYVNINEALDSSKIKTIITKKRKLIYLTPRFKAESDSILKENKNDLQRILEITDASIIAESNVIIFDSNKAIYSMKDKDFQNRIRYTDIGIIKLFSKSKRLFARKQNNEMEMDTGIYLGGNYSNNYYHFLLEFITKFEVMADMQLDERIPLIVDRVNYDIPQFKELIEKFNFGNREIKYIEKSTICKINKLYYIESPNIIPPNIKLGLELQAEDSLYDFESLEFLRKELLKEIEMDNKYPQKIYISRKNASGRRKFNEFEVEKYALDNGFVIVYPEEHTIEEQVKFFFNANIILGGGGAAFTNILFCSKDCKVISFTNYKVDTSLFSTLAYVSGCDFMYFKDDSLKKTKNVNIHKKYRVDINRLNKILNEI